MKVEALKVCDPAAPLIICGAQLLRHSSVNTTLAHYIKDVPEVTANGMAQVEELFGELDAARQVVQ